MHINNLLPKDWFTTTSQESSTFSDELLKELSPKHPLHNKALEIIARKDGADDVLCHHTGTINYFSIIHLTWSGKEEFDPHYPRILFNGDIEQFKDYMEFE